MAIIYSSSMAYAETLKPSINFENLSGKVLLNQGRGFVPGHIKTALRPGDVVMLGESARATLHFSAEDCNATLDPATFTTVTDASMCQAAAAEPIITPVSDEDVDNTVPAVLISIAIVGGAGFVLIDALSNDETPVSGN